MRRILGIALILALLATSLVALPQPVQAASTTFQLNGSDATGADAFLMQGQPYTNNGGYGWPHVKSNTGNDNERMILKFNISSIPVGSTITSATLKLKTDSVDNALGRTHWAYRLTETDWVEGTGIYQELTGTCCWYYQQNSSLAWTAAGGTYTTDGGASATVLAAGNWMSWTVTSQVQYAATNGINAHFLIKDGTEDGSAHLVLYKGEGEGANAPKLEVTYTPPPTVDLQIAASADDGFCDDSGNYPGYDYANCATAYVKSGLRWPINIPDGATITTAYIQLKSSGNNYGSRNGQIELFDEDDATSFSSTFWTRAVVTSPSAVLWDYTNWTDGNWYTSPSITTLVQAFIDRTNYSPGNYIGLRITGQTEYEDWRAFYTYDNAAGDGAKLHIEYVVPPTVTTHPSNQSITYGSDANFTAAASGTPTPTVQWQLNTGSSWSDISGETSTTLTVTKPPVSYDDYQYRAVFTNGGGSATTDPATLTLTAKTLTVTGVTASNKEYDGTTTATLNTGSAALVGAVGGDDVSLNTSSASGAFDNKNVGTGKTVTVSGLSLDGTDAGNYTLTQPTATADITVRAITVTADAKSKTEGDADPALTYTITSGSLAGGDSFTGALSRESGEDPGTYAINQGTLTVDDGNSGNNYTLTYVGATFTINPLEAPTVTNSTGASNITQTSVRLNGEVTDTGGNDPTVYIYWGDNDGGTTAGNWDNNVPLGTKGAETFYTDISSLSPNTTYYYRCYAENSVDGVWADNTTQFTTLDLPTITSVTPNAGPVAGGTTITITGTNFTGGATVTIGSDNATSVVVVDATEITAETPAGTVGSANVTVTTDGGSATLAGGFTYAAVPTIVSVSPAYGSVAGGTNITITGTNFVIGLTTTVTIDSANATSVVVVDATEITAVTPSGTLGNADVKVTTPGGSDTKSDGFTYVLEAPTVTSVNPNSGSSDGGTNITITGTNFVSGATVTIGSTSADNITIVGFTTITAITPAGTVGSANVTVTTGGGSATLADGFTYTEAPSVTDLGPTEYTNGSFISDTTPTLQFTLSDPNASDTVSYQIQIANTAAFSSPVVDYTSALLSQGATSFTVGQALAGSDNYSAGSEGQTLTTGDYYWRVMPTDNDDNTGNWAVANSGSVAFRIDQNSYTEATGSGNVTITNTNAATSVTKIGSGAPTITISRYASNPGGSAPSGFSCGGSHIDVHADNVTGIDEIQIKHYYTDAEISGLIESTLKMYYQSGTTWLPCSDTGVDTAAVTVNSTAYSGYVWANISDNTTPDLDYLLGSSFCGIGQVISGGSVTPGGGGGGGSGVKPPPPPLTLNQLTTTASLTLDASGIINTTARVKTPSGEASLYIAKGTKLLNSAGQPLTSLSASVVTSPPAPPSNRAIVSAYNFGADGATFKPAITLTMSYNPAALPEGVSETELYIAYWDGTQWVALDTTVDTNTHTLSAEVSHFTLFAILVQLPSIPEAYFTISNLNISPSEVRIGEEIIISAQVANTGGMSGEYTLTMNVEGLPETSQTVELAPGQSQGVSFTLTPDAEGSYQVEIGGLQGSFTVLASSLLEGEVGGVKWSLWLILVITTMALAALAFILIRKRQQLVPVVTGEKPPKPTVEKPPAAGPSRLGKIMAAVATLIRKRLQPTKAEEPVPTMAEEPLEPTPTVVDIFTVDVSAGAGGSISPSGMVMVNLGNAQSFTITPDVGYHVADVLVDGASVGAVTSYTFADVTADHTISASFAIDTFTVNAEVSGNYGSVSPATQTVDFGTSAVITITPDNARCHIATITDNGNSVRIANPYIVPNVTADHTVVVTFITDIKNLKIIPHQAKPGEVVNIFAEVTNNDPTTTTFSLVLKVRGIVEAVKEITLEPGQSQKVAFVTLRNKPGVYEVELEGLKGSFTVGNGSTTNNSAAKNSTANNVKNAPVVEEPLEPTPEVSLAAMKNLKIIPHQVKPGEIVNIFAEVTNNDPTTTTFSLVLKVRGIVEAVKEITLEPGQSQKVAFVTLRNKPGVYEVELEGLKGSFTVEK